MLKYASDWECMTKYADGAGCSINNDHWCSSGKCGENYCCSAAAVSQGCSRCVSGTGACSTQVDIGETCTSDADCYDGYGCAGGRCCASTSGYTVTNCQTCGTDGKCLECEAGYESFSWSSGTRCRKECESNEMLKYASDWECMTKYADGAGCSINNDHWCSSGKCGENYCCSAAAANSSTGNECCSMCGSSGQCLKYSSCITTPTTPPPLSEGSSPASSISPPPPTLPAQDKKAAAEKTRDSILADIADARLKAKAKLLADAAIAGVKVQRLTAKLSAADEDAACSSAFTKAEMSASDGACVAKAASSGKRRLSATTYDVEIMFSSAVVSDDALTKAADALKAKGVDGVTSESSVDPIAELKTVPGVDTSNVETFEAEAEAAVAEAVAEPPPPAPSPPPPSLILDDDDHASTHHGCFLVLTLTALNFLL